MKEFLKHLYASVQLVNKTIISIVSVILFSNRKSDSFFKNEKQKHEGGTCYIFGNGPSLHDFFSSVSTEGKEIYVVNYFALSEYFQKVKPTNYIVLDNVLVGNPASWEYDKEKVESLYRELSTVDWKMTFYYPSNGNSKMIERLKENPNITICIYNMTPVSGYKSISHWLFKRSLGMPWPQNISNAAVFCALNSGYKKIYLYGVEHSWLKSFDVHPETHKIYMNDGHFYEKDNIRWFKKGDYCQWLLWINRALQSHFELREYADSIGAKIVNKTPTSFIEAYEFDEY